MSPTPTYTAHLMDCYDISDTDRRDVETLFCSFLENTLGGPENVVNVYRARFDTLETGRTWVRAERQATLAAFAGWPHIPDSAYFEINVNE